MLLICVISERKDDSSELEEPQKNQSDPQTSGPAENLREEAAEIVDEDKDEEEPV